MILFATVSLESDRRKNGPKGGEEAAEEFRIGPKIKDLRKERGLTLQEVADETGFSPALISQIERGNVSPPIATLARLARFFDVRMGFFFKKKEDERPFKVMRLAERRIIDRVVSPNGHRHGYVYETLAPYSPKHRMEPFLVSIEKEAAEGESLYSHEGEEFLFVLKGKVRLLVGEEEVILEQGDGVYFDSSVKHRLLNNSRGEAKVIAVICR